MTEVQSHILTADVGGTNLGIAIFAYRGAGKFEPVAHRTYRSKRVRDFGRLLARFLNEHGRHLSPRVGRACIDFAGPVGPRRDDAFVTNAGWGFSAAEVRAATGLDELVLLNDFEAVGYGLEVLLENRPDAFVRLSRAGRLAAPGGARPTAVVMGAGTGLGTTILVEDRATGKYRPVPGEGGHADFLAAEPEEFRIAQWIRTHRNRSPSNPLDCEKVVSGRGLVHVYEALASLELKLARPVALGAIRRAAPYDRPARVVAASRGDPLARRALDIWLRCYGRAAKNCAIFPLAPGGIFLAGGIAAKILPEMQSGPFMAEFTRCDVRQIRDLLRRTPVWVVTDYRIGIYGCASVAVHFFEDLTRR